MDNLLKHPEENFENFEKFEKTISLVHNLDPNQDVLLGIDTTAILNALIIFFSKINPGVLLRFSDNFEEIKDYDIQNLQGK